MGLPVHRLASPPTTCPLLTATHSDLRPGYRFAYNNGGYVMLAIAAKVAGAANSYDLVRERVLDPAGDDRHRLRRSDQLPAGAAIGYLDRRALERPAPAGPRRR